MSETYGVGNLPGNPAEWPEFKKKVTTRMTRMTGPFRVETREGTLRCDDGWLAVDSEGYPYPIVDVEQKALYAPVADEVTT